MLKEKDIPECALTPGTVLQGGQYDYVIDAVLGVGGFGITYRVSARVKLGNVWTNVNFAVKEHFLSDSCERDHSTNQIHYSNPVKDKVEESKRDFIAEALRLNKASVDHDNIVHVNEVFEANNTAYYVMEYIEGVSLRDYITKNGVLTGDEAVELMLPIIKAVEHLHANKLTHLDIKPDNVMLRKDDDNLVVPVLIDFGLSKHYDEKGKPTSAIRIQGCSDGYAPMEQYLGINTFTPQADVYAVAATMLYCLIGKDPVIASECNREYLESVIPAVVSDVLKNALIKAMHPAKNQRTATITAFAKNILALDTVPTVDDNEGTENDDSKSSGENKTEIIKSGEPKTVKSKPKKSTEIIESGSGKKKNGKKWLWPLILIIVFFGSAVGYYFYKGQSKNEPVPVDTATASNPEYYLSEEASSELSETVAPIVVDSTAIRDSIARAEAAAQAEIERQKREAEERERQRAAEEAARIAQQWKSKAKTLASECPIWLGGEYNNLELVSVRVVNDNSCELTFESDYSKYQLGEDGVEEVKRSAKFYTNSVVKKRIGNSAISFSIIVKDRTGRIL